MSYLFEYMVFFYKKIKLFDRVFIFEIVIKMLFFFNVWIAQRNFPLHITAIENAFLNNINTFFHYLK